MRLIDADALLDDLMERYCKACDRRRGIKSGKWRVIYEIGEAPCRACGVGDMMDELEEMPSAERTGHWRRVGARVDLVECSACGYRLDVESYTYPSYRFCPNCGGRMKGEEDVSESN